MKDFAKNMHARQQAKTSQASQDLKRLKQLFRYTRYDNASDYEKHFLNNCLF